MPKFPNAELLELFSLEVESYIPEIRQGLQALSSDRTEVTVIKELHRLFHNIKGAASQIQLSDLSDGARVVETTLDIIIEKEQPVSDHMLAALERTVDLLANVSVEENLFSGEGHNFHEQIVSLFFQDSDGVESGCGKNEQNVNELQEYLHDVRSIFPLLQDLAGCLTEDGRDNDRDILIYGKLSYAVSLLAGTFLAAGMKQQNQLMQDFHLLMDKLHSAAIPHQPEMPGLILDFLQFLEVSFSHEDPENSTTIKRVKEQLQRFKALLVGIGQEKSISPAEITNFDPLDIFDDSATDDESIDLLEELTSDLIDEEKEEEFEEVEPHGEVNQKLDTIQEEQDHVDEPVDEDQLLLMEIFREECDEHLIVVNQSLNILENKVHESCDLTPELKDAISEMRRAVHTLKGAASMTGVNLLAKGAHSLEDMLDWLHDEAVEISPLEVQIIANGIDVIEILSQSPQSTNSARLDELVHTIDKYLTPISELEESGAISQVGESVEEETVTPAAPPEITLRETEFAENAPAALEESGTLRVKLEDLDELLSIEGELIVTRGAMEKMVEEFSQTLFELENVKENLRRKSQELESGFEVQSLYGFNPIISQGGSQVPDGSDLTEFDPIELDRYSQLNLIIRSLNEISVDVNSIHTTLTSLAGDISGQVGRQQLTMRLMQDKLMRIRMTPLSSISRVLFRTVRDTATKLGKKAALTITGEDVYMDRFVWAKITDPLMHILRNGVDHGIETGEVRLAAGKAETGTINIQAEQRSRYVVLRISDDGGGVDFSLIKDKISRERLADNPETLDEKQLLEFLFHPSFTTRQNITTISGRGVGLDVVKRNIQGLRGSIKIHNHPGQGVEFEIHIPFSLSVNRAVMVSVAGKEFAIPLQDILEVKHFSAGEIIAEDGLDKLSLKLGTDFISLTNLAYHLQLEKRMDTLSAGAEGILAILFMRGEEQCAVAIDAVIEQREIIIKNLGSHLTHVRGISGVTLTGSGGLIPILNLRELVEEGAVDLIIDEPLLQMELNEPLKVLIVDDSISVRHSVARLVESQSWKQLQAVDGLDALAKLENFSPDVIILDIEMPRMNGYEFKSSLNNQPMYKDIPIVMLTSRASEKHQQKAGELGIEHYLTKPYQDDVFVRLLENIRSGN